MSTLTQRLCSLRLKEPPVQFQRSSYWFQARRQCLTFFLMTTTMRKHLRPKAQTGVIMLIICPISTLSLIVLSSLTIWNNAMRHLYSYITGPTFNIYMTENGNGYHLLSPQCRGATTATYYKAVFNKILCQSLNGSKIIFYVVFWGIFQSEFFYNTTMVVY